MAPLFCILSSESSKACDEALDKFAQFLGLRTKLVPMRWSIEEPPSVLLEPAPCGRVLALGHALLQQLYQRKWFADLLDDTPFVFVYGFGAAEGEMPELKWLTGGELSAVTAIKSKLNQFTVHSDVRYADFPVSGKSYTVEPVPTAVFSLAGQKNRVEAYITVNNQLHFVSLARGSSVLFLLAEPELVDIDKILSPECSLRVWYAQLIAVTLFLRIAFGDWCWTSPVTGATLIVDDPYLKKRYGFVHYETLIQQLERLRAALTIAFIPYNYRRSDLATVNLLRAHSDRFSISIHGCDHTDGEFASLDTAWLTGTTSCSLHRMKAHEGQTRMPFDNIMVFPQGKFSTKAIGALKACGITAAVNTTPWAVDYQESCLTIRDFLEVAVMRYESFPIFIRRYPLDVFDYAFDAIFQKPILAVEHHGFFRHGDSAFEKLVQDVSSLSGKVKWMPLGRTVVTSCVIKRIGNDQFALRHFASAVRLRNSSISPLTLFVEKSEQGRVKSVIVGNQEVPFKVHSGVLRYVACIAAQEELNATILYCDPQQACRNPSWKYLFAASTRRVLSDFRDNQLARSERILSLAEKIKKILASGKRP